MNYSDINPRISYDKYKPYSNADENPSFSLYQNHPSSYSTGEYYQNGFSTLATRGNELEEDELSKLFFSDKNMRRIQHKIRQEIYNKTKGQFRLEEDQDEADLLIAMRAVFLQDAKHLPTHLVRQVKLLNEKTVVYIVPDMITNIKQHYGYIRDINKPLEPMMRPLNVNNAGRKMLPSMTTIFNM
jgi:hypothetical protein